MRGQAIGAQASAARRRSTTAIRGTVRSRCRSPSRLRPSEPCRNDLTHRNGQLQGHASEQGASHGRGRRRGVVDGVQVEREQQGQPCSHPKRQLGVRGIWRADQRQGNQPGSAPARGTWAEADGGVGMEQQHRRPDTDGAEQRQIGEVEVDSSARACRSRTATQRRACRSAGSATSSRPPWTPLSFGIWPGAPAGWQSARRRCRETSGAHRRPSFLRCQCQDHRRYVRGLRAACRSSLLIALPAPYSRPLQRVWRLRRPPMPAAPPDNLGSVARGQGRSTGAYCPGGGRR